MKKFIFPQKLKLEKQKSGEFSKKSIGDLHAALGRFKVEVRRSDLARKDFGTSTVEGLRLLQGRLGLAGNGQLTEETVNQINLETDHQFIVKSKVRTQALQNMLTQAGFGIAGEEIKKRQFGESTSSALRLFQGKAGLQQNGKVTEEAYELLTNSVLKERMKSKTQVERLHQTLLRALYTAKLPGVRIDANELKEKKMGPSTQEALKVLQKKYGLKQTGEADLVTYDRLTSLAASIPQTKKVLKFKAAKELRPLNKVLRLNMQNPQVKEAQKVLSFLGFQIHEGEFKQGRFGKSTREAVLQYQKARGQAQTGHLEMKTMMSLNLEIRQANPLALSMHRHRVRGSVRDKLWQGIAGAKVQVWHKPATGDMILLAERESSGKGFFDIPYDLPESGPNQEGFIPLRLQVKVFHQNGSEIGSKNLPNPALIAWTNFTEGAYPYRGISEFQTRKEAIAKSVAPNNIATLEQKPGSMQISAAAESCAYTEEDVARIVLSYQVAAQLKENILGPETCYAFIAQNLPSILPGDLLEAFLDWQSLPQLVTSIASALVFMDEDLQKMAFENAIVENLIPIAVTLQKEEILELLKSLKSRFALEQPMLVGNASLKNLLDLSLVKESHYTNVAEVFVKHKNLDQDFWSETFENADQFGGVTALKDLRTTVEVGQITGNFQPMLKFLKQKVADPGFPRIQSSRDLAKLTLDEWESLIRENQAQVPGVSGAGSTEQVRQFAQLQVSQSESLFPDVSLVSAVARSVGNNFLPKAETLLKAMDGSPDFNLRTGSVELLLKNNNMAGDQDLLSQARVVQRVHRLAPHAVAGQVLLENKIHNSSQIIAMGKKQFVDLLTKDAKVDMRTAMTIFGFAEHQYAQVLQYITEYSFNLHRTDPRAIVDHTYTQEELEKYLDTPNLKALFGSMDFCSCSHCQSVYGPSAYLADLLRFMSSHDSEVQNKKVKDILFERRPDIGNIKLNCENSDTPLPYVDLACEILENAMAPENRNFSFQTTRSAAELRTFPENVREKAYETLRTADSPLSPVFDLWQHQARLYLKHLGVNRWELMEILQGSPSKSDIAGEFFGICSHETSLITTTTDNTLSQQKKYWGIQTVDAMKVSDFMSRAKLTYTQVLELLSVSWINPAGAGTMTVQRPEGTCDTDLQAISPLSVDAFDKMHRFLRLWRHTSWQMWELDLLIRAPAVGGGQLNSLCLERLQQFKQLQERLRVSVEQGLLLFANIVIEKRVNVEKPQISIPSFYESLFQNPSVTSPLNPVFELKRDASGNYDIVTQDSLITHKSTVLAAFSINEPDLLLLKTKLTGEVLNLAQVSQVGRYALFAQRLGLNVKDLLVMEALFAVSPFSSLASFFGFIGSLEWMRKARFSIDELEYTLSDAPDSTMALSAEGLQAALASLQEALRGNTDDSPDGTIISQVASDFGLTVAQSQILLNEVKKNGKTLLEILRDPQSTSDLLKTVCRLLHKASLVINKLAVDAVALKWLLTQGKNFEMLDFASLPVEGVPQQSLFSSWLNTVKWAHTTKVLKSAAGVTLQNVIDLAMAGTLGDVQTKLCEMTQWNLSDLTKLGSSLGYQNVQSFKKIDTYLCLQKCFEIIGRLGGNTGDALVWGNRTLGVAEQKQTAQQLRQVAKSRYDNGTWLEKAKPIEDEVREKKRDALIAYWVDHSMRNEKIQVDFKGKKYANPRYWRDANDLLKYFLIDVEMCSCQLTSRTKQAISSTQMFVQRCLLGLEQPYIEISRAEQNNLYAENSWKQWKWMKSYRLWEANRKVFLYPENWIEPELRDDKSPFFQDLENELLQSEITDESAEVAFRRYVEKVHEVARLDLVGTYYELDDKEPYDNLPPDTHLLHVVGRTKGHPAIYYYRKFDLNIGEWTAWEKIDLDIKGDQVVPVVYNRRLYLFWLNFIEKPQKMKKTPPVQGKDHESDAAEAPHQLEFQLCWSIKQDEGWSPKRISQQKIIHPWQRPLHSYNLKPRYKSRENLLWLDVYISQSPEFNNGLFWDPYVSKKVSVTYQNAFIETARPWHSSSFVFDGQVTAVKMKPLRGYYRVVENEDWLIDSDSLQYVRNNFGEGGRSIEALANVYEIAPRLPLPEGMHYQNTKLVNNQYTSNQSYVNVLENGQTRTLFRNAPSPFEVVASQHSISFDTVTHGQSPIFYQDRSRSFFINSEWKEVFGTSRKAPTGKYHVYPFYHAFTGLFLRELNRSGLEGLLKRHLQASAHTYYPQSTQSNSWFDVSTYGPENSILRFDQPINKGNPQQREQLERVDFERYGAYSIYNWEIFFHAPFMVACKLNQNQRFEEAMRWFHYIFDPTNTDSSEVPQRYWVTKPFYEQNSEAYRAQRIDTLLKNIGQNRESVSAWKNNPFKPHLIARFRPVAYQKAVVMRYIDNLIDWGDSLFRRDTLESINEATTLYVLAYELLGSRPVKVPNVEHMAKSYNELVQDGSLDAFGNKRMDVLMENFAGTPVRITRSNSGSTPLPVLDFYFSIPDNDYLLGYWDKVEDRLFKIRHCMNIDGVVRQLPLFEPPIDPALLVKAAAAGLDLGSVMTNMSPETGPYRFQRVLQKALEFCGEVRAFGEKLLAALEKFDGEGLALLRSTHEIRLHEAALKVKKQQLEEAEQSLVGLEKNRQAASEKQEFYASREFTNDAEKAALVLNGYSAISETPIALGYILSGVLSIIPKVSAGINGALGSPHAAVDPVDGAKISKAAELPVDGAAALSRAADKFASLASTMGGYQRRQDDWDFQEQQAKVEVEQLDKQILAAQVRIAIAEQEIENQEKQIEDSKAVDEYMRDKYTNQQLYDWQAKQVAALYFQSYQLAFDMAKRAEKCFQYELDLKESFVQYGHWSSLRKGLLSGERLANDLRRMEAAYLEKNTRDLELIKNISIAQLAPQQLLALKEHGECTIELPEWLFDMDYPGHYLRRIKTVSLSIPCVVGPYTNVNSTLTLEKHGVRLEDRYNSQEGYGDLLMAVDSDKRFRTGYVPKNQIATSHGQNDAGTFELNFNDERFLPFEGAGAVSRWKLSLPQENNHFDLSSISDVILHMKYTAKPGVQLVAPARQNVLDNLPKYGVRLFALNREFASEWHRFVSSSQDGTMLSFVLGREHLPFYFRSKESLSLTKIGLILEGVEEGSYAVDVATPNKSLASMQNGSGVADEWPHFIQTPAGSGNSVLGTWQMRIQKSGVKIRANEVRNAYLVVQF